MASQFISLPLGQSAPTGTAGGDLSGTYPNPTVNDTQYPHRYTLAQRLALSPTDGTVVYDTTLRNCFVYSVNRWFPAHPIDPVNGAIAYEDWANNQVAGVNNWTVTGNTGADSGMIFDGNPNAVGQVYLEQSNGTNGYATLYLGNSYNLSAQTMFYDVRCYVTALSTSAQEYVVNVGFGEQVDATTFGDGVYFCYDRATDGDFWSCKTANSSVTTKTVTAVAPVGGAYQTMSVFFQPASVKFYIANALVATHTTNIPITNLCAPKLRIVKTNGSTARRLITDFFDTQSFFNTRRI